MNKEKSPNILWICSDQQRYDTLGCYGNAYVHTPNLDKLAERGALFENAVCQSPICSPSRGSFLTGRYPITCHQRQNGADIPSSEILVTKLFHDAGYYCGLSGKLHIRACNPASGCKEMESRIDDGYDEFHWSHDTGASWGLHNEYYQWLHDTYGTTYHTENTPQSRFVQFGMPIEQHQSYWCADKAIEFITSNKESEKPWLFSVNMYDPHHPFDPPRELLERYLTHLDDIPLPDYIPGEEQTKTIWQQQDHTGAYNHHAGFDFTAMNNTDHRMVRAAYWAMCDMIDLQIGRMLDALKKCGELDNTIILFHSDHGEMLGDHGVYLKGPYFYDPCVKIPLIISWPGHVPQGRYTQLVQLMDLPKTILELSNIPTLERMQGDSLCKVFESRTQQLHESAYCEYLNAMPWHKNPKAFASMVRTNDWKLVVSHSVKGEGEMYDLHADPGEHHNLYTDSRYLGKKEELMEELLNHWAHMADPEPLRKSDW